MKKSKILSILIICAMALAALAPAASADGEEDFLASSVLLAETTTGASLYEKNADMRRPPDTMVKIMTLLLAAEAVESGAVSRSERVTASESAFFDITEKSETRGITAGEAMPFFDLMVCAYVGGGNEACNIIAERVSGSVAAFVEMMNERADELGCADTNFTNPHGQQDKSQYTTARDLFFMAQEAARNPVFTEVAASAERAVAATNASDARSVVNSNYMLNPTRERYYYKYAIFGKVSATYESGYGCLEYSERDGLSTIAVLLGSSAITTDDGTIMQNLTEAKRLLEWGGKNYAWTKVLSSSTLVERAEVEYGDGADFVNLHPDRDVTLLLPSKMAEGEIVREIRVYSADAGTPLTAPVRAGDELGEITLSRDGRVIARARLLADTTVGLLRAKYIKQQIFGMLKSRAAKWILISLVALFVLYGAIVVRYQILRARHMKKVKAAKRKIIDERRNGGE
ncbi:MAG: serine hydrolase [Oscillospiraceae bacterium]|jgi:D-alanyl-D-alanine carboxypeptidase (penicillin-binding protein 5/6)|nr:serine hydrolase [Oscillospiraceae bacterium]